MTAMTENGLATQTFAIGTGQRTAFGAGAIHELPAILADLRQKRAFVVTDPGVTSSGIVGTTQRVLEDGGIEVTVWDGIHPNPSTSTLDAGAQAARRFGQAAVVAVGGGSVLDASKGIALMAVNDGRARDFDYRRQPEQPGLPLVAIPTTAGTGAETNSFGVIDDPESERKFYVGHHSVTPRAVILDPELTLGLPPGPTAATGMDVLTHALESLSSRRNNPYAEGINLQVVRMVNRFLPVAVADGRNLEARSQMLLAAHMAGMAFATTGLGLGHALAHALSARMGAAHGQALAVVLPHVLVFNLPVRGDMYSRVARALETASPAEDDGTNAETAIEQVRRLASQVGMPGSLQELGCKGTIIGAVVRDALEDEVLANTPRMPTMDQLETLLKSAL